jgi:hypothetical protein
MTMRLTYRSSPSYLTIRNSVNSQVQIACSKRQKNSSQKRHHSWPSDDWALQKWDIHHKKLPQIKEYKRCVAFDGFEAPKTLVDRMWSSSSQK